MNNTSQIKQLLNKYFEGETSLEEERVLKVYFNGNEVANELKAYQGLFQFFKIEKEVVFPEKADTAPTPLYAPTKNIRTKAATNRRLYVYVARIAAVLLVAVCAYLVIPSSSTSTDQKQAINWEQYEITDEQEAVEKTIAALRLVSAKLNGGAKRAVKEVHHVQAAAKIFKK